MKKVTRPKRRSIPGSPIETMMPISVPLGNVIKYALRARFKGTEMTDIEKMAQYADWDVQVMRAEKIDPRKVHP